MGNYKPPRQQQSHQPRDYGVVAFIHRGRGDSGGRGHDNRGGRSGGTDRSNATVVSSRIADVNNITNIEKTEAESQTSDVVKAAILISGAYKRRYGGLKNDLGINYLMGTYQYPDTTVVSGRLLPQLNQSVGHGQGFW